MKVQIHSIRFDADQKLIDYIQKRMDKLENYFDRIIDGEVFLKIDNDNQNGNKVVEIKLNIPKEQLFAKHRSRTFESATDETVDALRRQLKKHKTKLFSH